jgi:hypothetical protein
METRSKLALLEVVGGLFGWLWIVASVASIYFLVAALAFKGRWSSLFWAVGTAVIAKWLARGFNDNQKRFAYEESLVSRGLTQEEARGAWFKAYTQGTISPVIPAPASATSGETSLLEAQELVTRYGAVLEHSKTLVRSEATLPASKEQIKRALITVARQARRSGSLPETLEPLRAGYASLADFLSEREAEATAGFDALTAVTGAQLDNANLRDLAAKIATAGPGALDVKRRSTDEFARLILEFDEQAGRE